MSLAASIGHCLSLLVSRGHCISLAATSLKGFIAFLWQSTQFTVSLQHVSSGLHWPLSVSTSLKRSLQHFGGSHCSLYQSLLVSRGHCMSLAVSTTHCQSLTVSTGYCMSQTIFTGHCQSVQVSSGPSISMAVSLPVSTSLKGSLLVSSSTGHFNLH